MLFDFTLAGAGLYFLVRILQFRQKQSAKNEIQKLQARVSMLRIALKAKVKKRANSTRVFFSKNIVPGDILESEIDQLGENKFETSKDFQTYYDRIKNIQSQLLQLHSSTEISYLCT